VLLRLWFELKRRQAVGMRRHQVRGPKPHRQRQFRAMHHRAGRDRGLTNTRHSQMLITLDNGITFERNNHHSSGYCVDTI
jgi:hypothetical protein